MADVFDKEPFRGDPVVDVSTTVPQNPSDFAVAPLKCFIPSNPPARNWISWC